MPHPALPALENVEVMRGCCFVALHLCGQFSANLTSNILAKGEHPPVVVELLYIWLNLPIEILA
jgi:hypothetical protein